MKKFLHIFTVLVLISGLAGFCLSVMNKYASPLIEDKKKKELMQAMRTLFPEMEHYEKKYIQEKEIYLCYDSKGSFLGYSIPAKGNGYQGSILLLVALSADMQTLIGIKVLENVETPGLGGRINEEWFQKQFRGRSLVPALKLKKQKVTAENEVQAISGATISSHAVVRIINDTLKQISAKLK